MPEDFAQTWLRSGSRQPHPYPALPRRTFPGSGNSQGRAAAKRCRKPLRFRTETGKNKSWKSP